MGEAAAERFAAAALGQAFNSNMVNRKRPAEDVSSALEDDNLAETSAGSSTVKKRVGSRQMQGDGGDGNKHSIDSDEENEIKDEKFEVLDDEDIEGQEDD